MNRFAPEKDAHFAPGVTRLAHDFLELGELQVMLLKLDLKTAMKRFRTMIAMGVVAAAGLLASFPIALFSLAELFSDWLDWSLGLSLAVSALIGLIISLVLFGGAWMSLRRSFSAFHRSGKEMRQNISCLKSWLRNGAIQSTDDVTVINRHVPRKEIR